MSEKEVRRILAAVCSEIDACARKFYKGGLKNVVLPTILGTGLAMSPGCLDRDESKGDVTPEDIVPCPGDAYGIPADIYDTPPAPEYGGPWDVPPVADVYGIPDAVPDVPPQPAYGVPMEDAGDEEVLPPPAEDYGVPSE